MSDKDRNDIKRDLPVEEYRLVPVEENTSYDEDEQIIDIVGVVRDWWDNRRTILRVFFAFIAIGAFIFIVSERVYYTESILMPEVNSGSQVSQLLQQYQNFFGVQQNAGDGGTLNVNLYPNIVESLPFQMELIQQPIYFDTYETEYTLFEYITQIKEETFFNQAGDFLWDITFGLPQTIIRLFNSPSGNGSQNPVDFETLSNFDTPRILDSRVRRAVESMQQWTTVRIEPQTGFIIIGVAIPDARAAAEAVNEVEELLKRHVTEYRTEKVNYQLELIQSEYDSAKYEYEVTQRKLAEFRDSNQNPGTQTAQITEQNLIFDYNRANSMFSMLSTRLAEMEIRVREETPVFRTHEPATIPTRPSTPNIKKIIFGSVFLGLFFGIAWIYSRRIWHWFFIEFKHKDPQSQITES